MSQRQRLNAWIQALPEPLRGWIPLIPPATSRNLWLLLAAVVATQNITVFTATQPANSAVMALLIWGGALICMEDQLEHLRPNPQRSGLFLGTVLLVWVAIRSSLMLHWDGLLYALAPLAGLALAALCTPLPALIPRFRDSLLCLLLLPGFALVMRVLPEEPISLLTARIAAFWVAILGYPTLVRGRVLGLPGGGVEVLGACNGVDMMAQILCVAVIFLLAFRIRSLRSRWLLLVAAPLIGLMANTLRIALLALITTTGARAGSPGFEFWHKETGSLIFSGLAVFVFGLLYMRLLERELPPLPSGGDDG